MDTILITRIFNRIRYRFTNLILDLFNRILYWMDFSVKLNPNVNYLRTEMIELVLFWLKGVSTSWGHHLGYETHSQISSVIPESGRWKDNVIGIVHRKSGYENTTEEENLCSMSLRSVVSHPFLFIYFLLCFLLSDSDWEGSY